MSMSIEIIKWLDPSLCLYPAPPPCVNSKEIYPASPSFATFSEVDIFHFAVLDNLMPHLYRSQTSKLLAQD